MQFGEHQVTDNILVHGCSWFLPLKLRPSLSHRIVERRKYEFIFSDAVPDLPSKSLTDHYISQSGVIVLECALSHCKCKGICLSLPCFSCQRNQAEPVSKWPRDGAQAERYDSSPGSSANVQVPKQWPVNRRCPWVSGTSEWDRQTCHRTCGKSLPFWSSQVGYPVPTPY